MYNRKFCALLAGIFLVCSIGFGLWSKPVSRKTGNIYVNDQAGVLSPATEQKLGTMVREGSNGLALSVVCVDRPRALGFSTDDYAEELWNSWYLGEGDMLLLLDIGRDNYWFLYSDSLAGSLDGQYEAYLNDFLEPSFAKEKYDEGVLNFANALYSAVKRDSYPFEPDPYSFSSGTDSSAIGLVFLVIIVIVIILLVSKTGRKDPQRVPAHPVAVPLLSPPGSMLTRVLPELPRASVLPSEAVGPAVSDQAAPAVSAEAVVPAEVSEAAEDPAADEAVAEDIKRFQKSGRFFSCVM